MRNKDFRKKHSDIINGGKKVYKVFTLIALVAILFYSLWMAYDIKNFDLFSSTVVTYIIFFLGFIFATIGEFIYSFKIKKNIPVEIRRDYIKNVLYRSMAWALVVGFVLFCSYILIPMF